MTTQHERDSRPEGALADVFISYARSDEEIARNIAAALKAEGFDVWFDSSIYAGADWESLLMDTLASAKAVVVLWSARSVERPWVVREADVALQTGRLISVKIEECVLPKRFDRVQAAVMYGWTGVGTHGELERLLAGISRLAPPSRIDNVRPGFESDFLGVDIELPSLAGVADEFRYLHFSVVMNPARRLAWYVAYNMEPYVKVDRGDRWMADPMLPATFQPHNEHFRGTGYDRGHLVSPRCVSWGTPRQAELANRQSFFWTNTAPQHPKLNQGWWLAVESWERDVVDSHHRAIGFSGPVFADDDPLLNQVEQRIGRLRLRQNFRLPRRYWKIVLVTHGEARLRSAAFVLDQVSLVESRTSPRAPPSRFRCTVADIEAATGLDFGDRVRTAEAIA